KASRTSPSRPFTAALILPVSTYMSSRVRDVEPCVRAAVDTLHLKPERQRRCDQHAVGDVAVVARVALRIPTCSNVLPGVAGPAAVRLLGAGHGLQEFDRPQELFHLALCGHVRAKLGEVLHSGLAGEYATA